MSMTESQRNSKPESTDGARPRVRPVVTRHLRRWLTVVFVLFAVLAINALYLGAVSALEALTGKPWQDGLYLYMFLAHLALGLVLIVPFLYFATRHMRRALHRPNRNAIRAGIGLFTVGCLLLLSGIVLTRFGFFEIDDPGVRRVAWWLHILTPFLVVWLFVLHRLAGPRMRWRAGLRWALAGLVATALLVALPMLKPGQKTFKAGFLPTLAETPNGATLDVSKLNNDAFCAECHQDIAATWKLSMHRFSSFNNPAYRAALDETRKVALQRDGDVAISRFCAGCHDILPLFSGRFDDPGFDPEKEKSIAHAGLTCTSCHAVSGVAGRIGMADYQLDEPVSYPFERSDNPLLSAIGKQLIRARPDVHKRGFLKPVLKTALFCSTCHKAHMPEMVNHYKWLPGQNHFDSFWMSGVSGHRVDSFYYPPKAVEACRDCHMPLLTSDDPAARDFGGTGRRSIHSHQFPAANTGVAKLLGLPSRVIEADRQMLQGALRVDIFGLRDAGRLDGELHAPLGDTPVTVEAGRDYLLEVVLRTLRIGHQLTQGTIDSNQLWVSLKLKADGRLIAESGAIDARGEVDPNAYFLNAWVLDRDGGRIARRNAQDIFVKLYDHQIPPGAASVVHYQVHVPEWVKGGISIEAAVHYRKFDSTYMRFVSGDDAHVNNLPVITLAHDEQRIPLAGAHGPPGEDIGAIETWQRWNDYGIGLLRTDKGDHKGALRQAEHAFQQVDRLGRADGLTNLARVYLRDGDVEKAAAALSTLSERHAGFRPWVRAWLSAQVERQRGNLDSAIQTMRQLLATRFNEARRRGFDFSRDYRAQAWFGRLLYERARRERGDKSARMDWYRKAEQAYQQALRWDPENLAAHYGLAQVYAALGDAEKAALHRRLHQRYRPDDNAVEQAVAAARRDNPVADHAAEANAVYRLRPASVGGELLAETESTNSIEQQP